MQVAAYVRVSTSEQQSSGLGLAAQRSAIVAEVDRRGWTLAETFEDPGCSAKTLKRPGIAAALEALDRGEAEVLLATKLDRLSRSMADVCELMARATKGGWAVVALDCAMDTSTPAGEAMAHMVGVFAHLERRLIGQRTQEALAAKREQGVRLGRPPAIDLEVERLIREYRAEGRTLVGIAEQLEADGVPTAHGGRWRPSTLARVLGRTPAPIEG